VNGRRRTLPTRSFLRRVRISIGCGHCGGATTATTGSQATMGGIVRVTIRTGRLGREYALRYAPPGGAPAIAMATGVPIATMRELGPILIA